MEEFLPELYEDRFFCQIGCFGHCHQRKSAEFFFLNHQAQLEGKTKQDSSCCLESYRPLRIYIGYFESSTHSFLGRFTGYRCFRQFDTSIGMRKVFKNVKHIACDKWFIRGLFWIGFIKSLKAYNPFKTIFQSKPVKYSWGMHLISICEYLLQIYRTIKNKVTFKQPQNTIISERNSQLCELEGLVKYAWELGLVLASHKVTSHEQSYWHQPSKQKTHKDYDFLHCY